MAVVGEGGVIYYRIDCDLPVLDSEEGVHVLRGDQKTAASSCMLDTPLRVGHIEKVLTAYNTGT